ncbi:MAG: ribosomal RNA small subunit methyltransferase A [Deltaproteobacteria bacterium]|nr:ribosomal RNA small subunit methyltransferase A [Deltaproteobacteria bacterium]
MYPSPPELLRRHGLYPKKPWGQCFLHDPQVVARIVAAAELREDDWVVEVGAGLGSLTVALAERVARVVAVERDRDLVAVLRSELAAYPRIELVEGNALTFDFRGFDRKVVVVGNLPYHIGTEILFRVLEQRAGVRSATFMLQKEVAQRLAAAPGSRVYGAPSVLCQRVAEVSLRLTVGRGAFTPPPRVDSAVVHLAFRDAPQVEVDDAHFSRVVHAAFSARRKTLKRALAARFPVEAVTEALAAAGVRPEQRGETLSVVEFGRLALALQAPQDPLR